MNCSFYCDLFTAVIIDVHILTFKNPNKHHINGKHSRFNFSFTILPTVASAFVFSSFELQVDKQVLSLHVCFVMQESLMIHWYIQEVLTLSYLSLSGKPHRRSEANRVHKVWTSFATRPSLLGWNWRAIGQNSATNLIKMLFERYARFHQKHFTNLFTTSWREKSNAFMCPERPKHDRLPRLDTDDMRFSCFVIGGTVWLRGRGSRNSGHRGRSGWFGWLIRYPWMQFLLLNWKNKESVGYTVSSIRGFTTRWENSWAVYWQLQEILLHRKIKDGENEWKMIPKIKLTNTNFVALFLPFFMAISL